MFDNDILTVWTDGSSYSKPRRGGVGFRFIFPENCAEKPKEFSPPGYKGTNNIQSELQACILALGEARRFLKKNKCFKKIIIYTDCEFISNNYMNALYHWSVGKHKWTKKDGSPVANYRLWKTLVSHMRNIHIRVDIKYTKGHSKDENNKKVDKLAKRSAKNAKFNPLVPTVVRRKRSPYSVDIGSVKMDGQKILIRIIVSMEKTYQGDYKYKYEVIAKKNKFFQLVDIIYSKKVLKPGHSYLVIVNKDQKLPQIVKVIKENKL